MSFLEAFPVRTLARRGKEPGSAENAPACGSKWHELLAKYDPNSRSWKTPQCSLLEGLELSLETWPKSGMTEDGYAYPQPNLVQAMYPTPTCHNAKEGGYPAEHTRNTPTLGARVGGKIHPEFTEWMMGWPIGWTDLKPLGMDKFQLWRQQHSGCLQEGKAVE